MKYFLAFALLFVTACDAEEEDQLCKGEAKYDTIVGNWVMNFYPQNSQYKHKLRLQFGDPVEEEAAVFYSCENETGDVASVEILKAGYIMHSPEQISIGDTKTMRPRDIDVECEPLRFGGTRYALELKGECLVLDPGNGKIQFVKGL